MKKVTSAELREAVNRQASGVEIDYRVRAADFVISDARDRREELTDEGIAGAIKLARHLAAWSDAEREPTEIRAVPLSDTAYSIQTEADWLETFSPFIDRVREEAFGSPTPPFDVDSLDEMQEWIEKADKKERWEEIDPDSQVGKLESEIYERVDQLSRLAPRRFHFSQTNGLNFTYLDSDNRLCPRQIESVPRHYRDYRGFLDSDLPPIGVVAIAAHQMAEITGFESHDVLLYILTGIPPRLRRVVAGGMEVYNRLPDGTKLTGAVVDVSIRTPDVTWRELLQVHRYIRTIWESLGHSPQGEQPQRRRLTKKDRRLMEILDRLGGPPETPDAEFWEDVHREWIAAGYNAGPDKPRKRADSHRRHWRILKEKLEVPGVAPSVGADPEDRFNTSEED